MSRFDDLVAELPDCLTSKDLTEIYDRGLRTIYSYLTDGVLPAYRLGINWVIVKAELQQRARDKTAVEPLIDSLFPEKVSLSTAEIADILRMKEETVRIWMRSGFFPGERIGRGWEADRDGVVAKIREGWNFGQKA